MNQYLNQSFQQDFKLIRDRSYDNDTDNDCRKKIRIPDLMAESQQTPNMTSKPIDTSEVDCEMFCLDEMFLEEYDNLSHISENINTCENWHDETIGILLDGSLKRPVKQQMEDEERREQENLREELSYILESVHKEQQNKGKPRTISYIIAEITQKQQKLLEIIQLYRGKLLSLKPLLVECANGHQWGTTVQKLLVREWCQKCTSSSDNNATRCKHNHPIDWRARPTMCKECKYQQKIEVKRQKMENRKRNFESYEKQQEEMLKQAKESFKCDRSQKIIKAFRDMECEIEKSANIRAQKYLEKFQETTTTDQSNNIKTIEICSEENNQCVSNDNLSSSTLSSLSQSPPDSPQLSQKSVSQMSSTTVKHSPQARSSTQSQPRMECLVALYKILLFPEDALSMYVKSQTQFILMQEYRNMAKLIHPDKIQHPKSRQAFTKLRKHWVERK